MNKLLQKSDVQEKIYKQYPIKIKAVNDEERRITFVISMGTPDRGGDIVEPDGGDFSDYEDNPVVPYGHDYQGFSYGRGENIHVEGNRIIGDVVFPPAGDFPDADIAYNLYSKNFQFAVSIGFIPQEYELIDPDTYAYRFTKWQMLEFSLVLIPMHQDALKIKTILKKNGASEKFIDGILLKEILGEKKELDTKDDEPVEGEGEAKTATAADVEELFPADEPKEGEVEKATDPEVIEEKTCKAYEKSEESDACVCGKAFAEHEEKELDTPEEFEVKRVDDNHISITSSKDLSIVVDLKSGRTISAKHEALLIQAAENIKSVLATAQPQDDNDGDEGKSLQPTPATDILKDMLKHQKKSDKHLGLALKSSHALMDVLSEGGGE